ncbi:N-acetylmuramoyl-L-alanine amidase [Vibrio quintilis]|uniref:N-acetylmuramoyl-L-alanine amidase n=1 Tax=Vibrio quintilis TaxID=1117707 RepID=A0A1M7YQX0_9VIBR|nr:N-acetylmuramoyl-L-alanine amidase [Vibrio quintilis]SHO55032.1 N-acetylmuramoyl-L-alanine amidase AmiB precursor [Vibrio quintilis]
MRSNRYFYSCIFYVCSFVLLLFSAQSALANSLNGIRIWPSPDETRVVVDLSSEARYSYFTLSNPYRLVVDLKDTRLRTKLPVIAKKSPVLKKIRKSTPPDKGTYRLVFELKKKLSPQVFKLAPTPKKEYGHRLVIDLPHGKVSLPVLAAPQKVKVAKDVSQFSGNADIVVAIDAGHGGEDPGSIGPRGKYEKSVTLSIAKKLGAQLNAVPGIKTVLTRRGDYFVNLNRRSQIARKNKAHLLISIHADAFISPQPRGASVFVLNTKRANSEIAKWVEDHEKQSELLGGAGQVLSKSNNDKNISQTLLDLQFSHSQKEGYKVARDILKEVGRVARLHKKKPVNASLAVLKSPDIPSVLVETGFISNPTEEKLLFQRTHQDKLARAMAKAVVRYFEDNPPEGTLFASRKKSRKHIVRRGESLSIIAQRYGLTVQALKRANHLSKNTIVVGKALVIPGSNQVPITVPVIRNPVETKIITHVVKPGDFLGKIASYYKVSVAEIRKENKLRSSVLKVGQKLKITVSLKDKPVRKHKVKKGDYLGKIANLYGVSISHLRQVNKLRTDKLTINQILIIPNR